MSVKVGFVVAHFSRAVRKLLRLRNRVVRRGRSRKRSTSPGVYVGQARFRRKSVSAHFDGHKSSKYVRDFGSSCCPSSMVLEPYGTSKRRWMRRSSYRVFTRTGVQWSTAVIDGRLFAPSHWLSLGEPPITHPKPNEITQLADAPLRPSALPLDVCRLAAAPVTCVFESHTIQPFYSLRGAKLHILGGPLRIDQNRGRRQRTTAS